MKKKIVSLCLVAALLSIAVMGTLAYLTDEQEVKNTFTVGKVSIDLVEDPTTIPDSTDATDIWETADDADETGATYEDVIPGVKYAKSVTVVSDDSSEDAWLFAEISLSNMAAVAGAANRATLESLLVGENLDTLFDSWLDSNGTFHAVFVYDMYAPIAGGGSWKLFDAFQLPDSTDNIDVDSFVLDVKAYACQSKGFDTPADAWTNGLGLTLHT